MPMTPSVAHVQTRSIDDESCLDSPRRSSRRETGSPDALAEHLYLLSKFCSRRQFSRNEQIFGEGKPAELVYRFISGSGRLCRHRPDGRRHIADFMLPGDLVGFVATAKHPVTAEAITTVTLTSYLRSRFDRLVDDNPQVRADFLSHVSTNLLSAQQHLFVMSCQNAKERFASFVLRMADRTDVASGGYLELSMGRQDIADHLGLTIETICRAIAALRNDGAIAVPNAHQLILKDIGTLQSISEGKILQ